MESRAAREPGDTAVRVGLGNHYMDREQWDEAIRMYERVVEAGLPAGADAEKRIQKIQSDRAALLRDAPAGSTSR